LEFVLSAALIFFKAMKKLDEADLWPWFLFLTSACFFIISSLRLHYGKAKSELELVRYLLTQQHYYY